MIRTIEEIRQRKIEGKKKWGKDLLEFIKPLLDDGRTYDEVVIILDKDYDIQINSVSLRNLKSQQKHKQISTIPTTNHNRETIIQKSTPKSEPTNQLKDEKLKTEIEQNQVDITESKRLEAEILKSLDGGYSAETQNKTSIFD